MLEGGQGFGEPGRPQREVGEDDILKEGGGQGPPPLAAVLELGGFG